MALVDVDLLPHKWAEEGRRRLEAAVSEWNASGREKEPIGLTWGYCDKEVADDDRAAPEGPSQRGLLCVWGHDVDVVMYQPDIEDPPPLLCEFKTRFPDAVDLPKKTSLFLKALKLTRLGVKLVTFKNELVALGVYVLVHPELLTGDILSDVIENLIMSAVDFYNHFNKEA